MRNERQQYSTVFVAYDTKNERALRDISDARGELNENSPLTNGTRTKCFRFDDAWRDRDP